jgi:NAD(P)-dependent dehydrogenase (short-subunit alcohol dehydrogenase family)
MTNATVDGAIAKSPRTVLVNGASRGIGLAAVQHLLADRTIGCVFATSRNATSSEALATLANQARIPLHPINQDITREASVMAAAAAVREKADRIDLILNCAGVLHDGADLQPEKRLDDVTPASLERSFAVNTIGPLLIAKHFQHMLDQQQRAVFATLSARVGSIGDNRLGGWYSYRASKAAQNMITRNLSIELRRRARGIIVVALHPGTVDTELSRPFQANVPATQLFPAEHAARQLLDLITRLTKHDNGSFFAWDGQPVCW